MVLYKCRVDEYQEAWMTERQGIQRKWDKHTLGYSVSVIELMKSTKPIHGHGFPHNYYIVAHAPHSLKNHHNYM